MVGRGESPERSFRDLPARSGPWQTYVDRPYRWRRDGIWDRFSASNGVVNASSAL